jgi:hypothetical protein
VCECIAQLLLLNVCIDDEALVNVGADWGSPDDPGDYVVLGDGVCPS